MRHLRIKAKVINPLTGAEAAREALVDTGATFTVINQSLHQKLIRA